MGRNKSLTSEESALVELVTDIVRVNPFGEERAQLDKQLTAMAGLEGQPGERFDLLGMALIKRLQAFEASGKYDLRNHQGKQRQMLFMVLLFDVFLRFKSEYVKHIRQQEQFKEPIPLAFADDIIGYLQAHGASQAETAEIIEYSYQIRRAYDFIDDALVGRSPSMIALRMDLWNNVFTHNTLWYRRLHTKLEDFSTLILGETGTGKGAAAQAIGLSSYIPFDLARKQFTSTFREQFIALNLSEFPEGLIESELFGHRKGAFTGALQSHEGVLSKGRPHGGIFLDELGDISLHLQVKLLQVIQNRTFSPVGSHESCQLHGRIIAATNKPIDQLLQQGLFREDFYYRLCTNEINMPTLRQRIAESSNELEELVRLIVARIVGENDEPMTAFVLDILETEVGTHYPWPGNVRELEQYTRRILLTGSCKTALTRKQHTGLSQQLINGIQEGTYEAKDLLRDYCQMLYQTYQNYNEVARQTNLDRRTVKKYVDGD